MIQPQGVLDDVVAGVAAGDAAAEGVAAEFAGALLVVCAAPGGATGAGRPVAGALLGSGATPPLAPLVGSAAERVGATDGRSPAADPPPHADAPTTTANNAPAAERRCNIGTVGMATSAVRVRVSRRCHRPPA
jgi:hypothetical protein